MAAQVTPSLVRTVVPLVVGFLITQALRLGWHLDEATATDAVTAVLSAAYYALARLLETKLGPRWGWLLGYASAPLYGSSTPPVQPVPDAE